MPLIEVSALRREYPPSVVALAQATFTVDRGETVAICGPSGSGKSTLLALLGLLDLPTSGSCLIDGVATQRLSGRERTGLRRSHIGFGFQAFHLIPHLTATENVVVVLDAKGAPVRSQRRRAIAALDRVGLAARRDSFPATMSGGEQQRVAIARAVATAPPLLLCDEPTGNLDSATSVEVMDVLLGLDRGQTAVVVVTHDPAVAARCARTLWVRDGTLSADPQPVSDAQP